MPAQQLQRQRNHKQTITRRDLEYIKTLVTADRDRLNARQDEAARHGFTLPPGHINQRNRAGVLLLVLDLELSEMETTNA